MKKVKYLAAVILFLALHTLNSQEEYNENDYNTEDENNPITEAASSPEIPDNNVYVITDFKFDIKGYTRPDALIYNGEFRKGEKIQGKANFEKYIRDKTQMLINQRVLEEVRIEYSLGEPSEDNTIPVLLSIYVKDTVNIIVLPYPKYDSNEGLSITLKARDYNFLGTMSPLRLDLGYRQKDDKHIVNFVFDSDVPFRAAGLDWNINFDHFLNYTVNDNEPLYYQNVTGLSVKIPWRLTTFSVGFNHYLTFNEENSDESKEVYNLGGCYEGPYGSAGLSASWSIPIGVKVFDFGEIAYGIGVSGRLSYPYGNMDEPRKPVSSFSHSLGFGRIDWIGNYRKGLSASINNGYSWYFDRSDAPLSINLNETVTFHWPFTEYFGISSRLNHRAWWQWSDRKNGWIPYYSAGDNIRGVIDDDIRAYYMLSLNLDFPFRVLRFLPSEWFNNRKLRLFDFEMHVAPFTDQAMFSGPYNKLKNGDTPEETQFGFEDMISTAGIEVFVYPKFFRSLSIRGSIGYNIKKIKDKGLDLKWNFFPHWDEIYIGVDRHY